MNNEVWRPIIGYESRYEVSSHGKVASLNYHRTKKRSLLKQHPTYNGYLRVMLSKNGKSIKKFVHRIMLEVFIGPAPTINHECAHNDGININNYIENLRWATRKENHKDKNIHGTSIHGERNINNKLTIEDVLIIKTNCLGKGKRHSAKLINQLSIEYKVSKANIKHILCERTWKQVPVLK